MSGLLKHFLDSSPRWLSTRTGHRRVAYLEWVSPAILENSLIRDRIFTIASADLCKYDRGDLELKQLAANTTDERYRVFEKQSRIKWHRLCGLIYY